MAPDPSIAESGICVGDAAQKPEAKDEEWELHRRHADGKAHDDQPHIGDSVFEDVRPVIRPEGELILCMMERMDAVPPGNPVRNPMLPVIGEIKSRKIDSEDDRRE